jgi:hypothetical protein
METIFISGKTNGLPREEVINKFNEAKQTLEADGYAVLSHINNDQPNDGIFEQSLLHRIKLLLSCDVVYFLDDWMESVESLIEHDIATRLNKVIIYQKTKPDVKYYDITRIKEAIHAVTGLTFDEYTTRSRRKEFVYARMLFANYCFTVENMQLFDIAGILKRDRATLFYTINKYKDDVKYNPKFRELANNLKKILVEFN